MCFQNLQYSPAMAFIIYMIIITYAFVVYSHLNPVFQANNRQTQTDLNQFEISNYSILSGCCLSLPLIRCRRTLQVTSPTISLPVAYYNTMEASLRPNSATHAGIYLEANAKQL